jgi:adenylate cyclase
MRYLKQGLIFILFSVFILLTLSYINFEKLNANLDEKVRDIFFDIRGEIPTSEKVVIIDIDEDSINKLGQWPFSRLHISQVLVNLANAGAKIIGIDIIFSEFDKNSLSYMAKVLKVKGDFVDTDILLSRVILQTPTISGYLFTNNNSKNNSPASYSVFDINNSKMLLQFDKAITSIPTINNNTISNGFLNTFMDHNGKVSKMPMIIEYQNKIYPSLALEMISITSETKKIKIMKNDNFIYALKLENFNIPIDKKGFIRMNYRGAKKSFPYISFKDILNGNFDIKDIENKFILIGSSLASLANLKGTTYDLNMPRVEIHANIIDNILQGDFLYEPSYVKFINILIIFFLTMVMGYISFNIKNNTSNMALLIIIMSGIYIGLYYLQFIVGIVLNLVYPIVSAFITASFVLYFKYIKANYQKDDIKNKFIKKVSSDVVEDLLSSNKSTFKIQENTITIFFSDIRSFTEISEKINSPSKLISMLNQYLDPMISIITKSKGVIDKFIGDSVMAYWNAPLPVANHADLATTAAIKQIVILKELNIGLKRKFDVTIKIGIGIHTGKTVVGEMGSPIRSDYTIIGDNVNLTSRIEGLTKYFGVEILISQTTKDLLKNTYNTRCVGSVVVKGKTEPIKLYEVLLDEDYEVFKKIKLDYEEAMNCFLSRKFEKSLELFRKINNIQSHKIHQLYISKIEDGGEISANFNMKTK